MKTQQKPELLAPAGNLETAVAAFEYGADAVYLGMRQFSARADVDNFSYDDLAVLTGYAHHHLERPRRVHVAVNTVLRQHELPRLVDTLCALQESGVDAVIVQDLGVARIIREHFPELTMHASTQMAIHNAAGMRQAAELGFKRVIAARELTLPEIRLMADEGCAELEVFIHGALCYAYSGLCLLSSVLRGSSGNRGECSYFCRNAFKLDQDGRKLADNCALMSMKDLALPESIRQLSQAGVASLKIEGRKKPPLWVAAVTDYYRKLLDDSFREGEREECENRIKTIFSRPWTPFFMQRTNETGITDTHTVGHRGVFCGVTQGIVPGRRGGSDTLRFMVKDMRIEKHDGLQVELNGWEKPYGFPVDDLWTFRQGGNDTATRVFTAEPETFVEVPLPDGHPDIPVGTRIFCSSSQAAHQAYRWPSLRPDLVRARNMTDFDVTVARDHVAVTASVTVGETSLEDISVSVPLENEPSVARQPEGMMRAAENAFGKLGGCSLELAQFAFSNPENLFLPVSQLNEIRRIAVEKIEKAIEEERSRRARATVAAIQAEAAACAAQTKAAPASQPGYVLKIDQLHYLNLFENADFEKIAEIIIDIQQTRVDDLLGDLKRLADKIGYNKIRLALPPILRGKSLHSWKDSVALLLQNGWRRWEIANIGSLEFLYEAGANPGQLNLTADWPMYCYNTSAAAEMKKIGILRTVLPPDDTEDNRAVMMQTSGSTADVILYQDTVLAISAVCANVSLRGECPGRSNCRFHAMNLTTRKGEKLIAVNNHCQTVYIAQEPLDLRHRADEFRSAGAQRFRLVFTTRDYTPLQVKQIYDSIG